MKEDFVNSVYNTLNGVYLPGRGVPGVENAFAEGKPCMELYYDAYDAYQRLCNRLGVVDEDKDVEIIFHSFMEISRVLGTKMYHYGALFG